MESETRAYKSHRIEVRSTDEDRVLLIDGEAMPHGQFPDGKFFLKDWAYDWSDDLIEVAQRYLDYRERALESRAGRREAEKGER